MQHLCGWRSRWAFRAIQVHKNVDLLSIVGEARLAGWLCRSSDKEGHMNVGTNACSRPMRGRVQWLCDSRWSASYVYFFFWVASGA